MFISVGIVVFVIQIVLESLFEYFLSKYVHFIRNIVFAIKVNNLFL